MTGTHQLLPVFRRFAEEKISNHQAELQTRYANETPDKETLAKGYEQHRKILARNQMKKYNPCRVMARQLV